MSLSDCEKCWDTPCMCGYGYRGWTEAGLREHISMLQRVLDDKAVCPNDPPCKDGWLYGHEGEAIRSLPCPDCQPTDDAVQSPAEVSSGMGERPKLKVPSLVKQRRRMEAQQLIAAEDSVFADEQAPNPTTTVTSEARELWLRLETHDGMPDDCADGHAWERGLIDTAITTAEQRGRDEERERLLRLVGAVGDAPVRFDDETKDDHLYRMGMYWGRRHTIHALRTKGQTDDPTESK